MRIYFVNILNHHTQGEVPGQTDTHTHTHTHTQSRLKGPTMRQKVLLLWEFQSEQELGGDET